MSLKKLLVSDFPNVTVDSGIRGIWINISWFQIMSSNYKGQVESFHSVMLSKWEKSSANLLLDPLY